MEMNASEPLMKCCDSNDVVKTIVILQTIGLKCSDYLFIGYAATDI